MKYIKSPLNYTGGKYKLLNQILPLFPKDINTFVDLFAGGCNVSINVISNNKLCNDLEEHVIDFYNNIKQYSGDKVKNIILNNISKYELSKTNSEGFNKCREDYNKNKSWDMFYTVVTHSFNNQIRYNNNGDYNMPFGKNRSSFNPSLQEKLVRFVDSIDETFTFVNNDFREVNIDNLTDEDFVYCDPPYLITTATYNEKGGWTEKEEKDLLELLDKLNDKGVKFALSNVFECKGKSNDILKDWSKKYNIHYIDSNYGNCSYHTKNKSKNSTVEVIITNYK